MMTHCFRNMLLSGTWILSLAGASCSNGAGGAGTSTATGTGGGTSTSNSVGGSSGNTSATSHGGSTNSGGAPNAAGSGNTGAAGATSVAPGSYALNPPKQCDNQFYVPNCTASVATSACGGKCSSINACQESTSSKPGDDITFACPRDMLYSDEMTQAAIDDGNTGFNYAVVGHDVDTGGIDGSAQSSCCQCYQLIFDYPAENQANVNASQTGPSAIPIPPPLIVQSFNTGTNGPFDFDVFLAAGGFGGNNACDPNAAQKSVSGFYQYTGYPADGGDNGGVKGAGKYTECKTATQWVTTASLSSAACQTRISTACNQIAASSAQITNETIRSCIKSNDPNSYYHLNWNVYAKRVECPSHLTEVTGCKLAPQGLPAVSKNVTTAAQAATDTTFRTNAANGTHFSTTTMQDCCKPTCAWQDNVSGKGLTATGQYNSFYSCTQAGVPITE